MAGLDETGLTIKRLPEVLADIETAERTNIDPSINTQEDELLGQLNTIIAAAIAAQWEIAEAVNDNFNPLKAEGLNLDDIAAIIGIVRIPATKSSSTTQLFTGSDGTAVPFSSVIENPNSGDRFITTASSTLSLLDCYSSTLSIQTVVSNTNYSLAVNSTPYNFLSDGDATATEIIDGLAAVITADTAATWTAVNVGDELVITTTGENIAVSSLTLLLPSKTSVFIPTEASEVGPKAAPLGTVVTLISTIAGLDSTTNTAAYTVGRDDETDEEFRERILISQQSSGSATVPAIVDAVSDVSGVSDVSVIENRTLVVDGDGRPGKSFETVVQGGTDADVAQTIWNEKPAGIETFGNTTVPVTDSSGDPQNINFSRPLAINIAFRISYTLYDEETFPSNGDAIIAATVESTTDALDVDEDVIPSRYFGPIYSAVDGINSLTVEIQVLANSGDAPDGGLWSTLKQSIDYSEFASTNPVDITVQEI